MSKSVPEPPDSFQPPRRVADRSAVDVVAATLAARISYGGYDVRKVAAHVVSDLIGADWFVIHRGNLAALTDALVDGG